ncbi:MAG: response regulator transcription factor [Acidobacteriaceae bacterium]
MPLHAKIMLFSADPSMVHPVALCLREAGYLVDYHSQGNGAMDIIQAGKPDMIILDLVLPGYSSLAIIRCLRSENSHDRIPVILMGATMREEDCLIGLEVGADLCMMETFHAEVFVARVKSLLRRSATIKVL